ncbi:MAG: hypothetical protein COA94_03410 [Rickettsiales bacterium]|nr:MAG: hypothetical protein COA94_03410 [Rickettsiales bacterium]
MFHSNEEIIYQNRDDQLGDMIPIFRHIFVIYFCDLKQDTPPNTTQNSYSLIVEQYKKDNEITYKAYFGYGDSLRVKSEIDFDISPKGFGIGSIIINHLIHWGKQNYPEAKIKQLYLSAHDEEDKNNHIRRDRLYNKIGLIKYKGFKHLSDLKPSCDERDFEVIDAYKYINQILIEQDTLRTSKSDLKGDLSYLEECSKQEKQEIKKYKKILDNPFRYTAYYLCNTIDNIIGYIVHWLPNKIASILKGVANTKKQDD